MPELQKPSLSVAAPKGASGAPESPAARAQRYKELVKEAQKEYPKKAGKIERHHKQPIYLKGPKSGETVPIDAAYHQKITNEFRAEVPYGTKPKFSAAEVDEIMTKIYDKFPLQK